MKGRAEEHECTGAGRRARVSDAVAKPGPRGAQSHSRAQERQQTSSQKAPLIFVVASNRKILVDVVDPDHSESKTANQKDGGKAAESPTPIRRSFGWARLVRVQ